MNTSSLPRLLALSLFLVACSGDGGIAPNEGSSTTANDTNQAEPGNGDTATSATSDSGGPVDPDAPCVPSTCGPTDCSVIQNGCGLEMDCGGCPDGIICGAHGVPNECEVICEKLTCGGAGPECGTSDDGCGGTLDCGDCTDGTFCGANGTPNTCGGVCIPDTCAALGFNCGSTSDGCGEIVDCGTCADTHSCVDSVCFCEETTCEAAGSECGPTADGCGSSINCGACPEGTSCVDGSCLACAPQCDGNQCGPDGCGGVCGTCSASKLCVEGTCKSPFCDGQCGSNAPQWCGAGCKCYCNANCFQFGDCCEDVCTSCFDTFTDQCCAPECDGKQCGPDGCGGVCGSCAPGSLCEGDQCAACEAQCDGLVCGDDQCGGTCGECDPYDTCDAGQCIVCVPNCDDDKVCGADGCGGSCGECGEGLACTGEQECVVCEPQCEGQICGPNGCGGSCNDCQFDCTALSDGPFELVKLSGPIASEDLAFDAEGNLIGSNDNAIFKSPYQGSPQVWVPNLEFRAGLRYLPTGDLVVNNDNTGQFLRVEPDGTIHVVLNNLAYPNGLAVHLDGWVVVTEHDAKRVLKVDPYANTSTIIDEGTIKNPNGAAFSPDYSRLYIAGFSGVGTIYAFPVSEQGEVGEVFEWKTDVGTGWLDGIGIDLCSNLYIADYYATKVFRFDKNGDNQTTVLQGQSGSNTYLPNMQWGSGLGGWDSKKIYLPDGWNKDVFEVDMGVPGIPKPYPPTAP